MSRQVRPTTALRRTQSATPTTPSLKSEGFDFAKKYGFHHLLDSPLPSPALPSITPRHGKKPPPRRAKHAMRLLFRLCKWLAGVSLLYWIASTILSSRELPDAVNDLSSDGKTYDVVADGSGPLEATPVVVTDSRGKARWTVSIPSSLEFPLRPSDYTNICQRSDEISERLQGIRDGSTSTGASFRYDYIDPNFIDVQEAEQDRLLPAASTTVGRSRKPMGLEVEKVFEDQKPVLAGDGICERSLTYVMETTDAGFGKTLMGLWMSYGLAKEEGRAFFIDDTNWYPTI